MIALILTIGNVIVLLEIFTIYHTERVWSKTVKGKDFKFLLFKPKFVYVLNEDLGSDRIYTQIYSTIKNAEKEIDEWKSRIKKSYHLDSDQSSIHRFDKTILEDEIVYTFSYINDGRTEYITKRVQICRIK